MNHKFNDKQEDYENELLIEGKLQEIIEEEELNNIFSENKKLNFEPLFELTRGSSEDINELWEICYPKIKKFVRIIASKKSMQLNDLLSYSYIIFATKSREYDPYYKNGFYPFINYILFQIGKNCYAYIQRHYFKAKRETPNEFAGDYDYRNRDENRSLFETADDIDNYITHDVKEALGKLKKIEREVIILRMKGFKQSEIGKIYNISQPRVSNILKTVKAHIMKAMKKEDKKMKEYKISKLLEEFINYQKLNK